MRTVCDVGQDASDAVHILTSDRDGPANVAADSVQDLLLKGGNEFYHCTATLHLALGPSKRRHLGQSGTVFPITKLSKRSLAGGVSKLGDITTPLTW